MSDDRTPWQIDRDRAEATGKWPEAWGPFHRHFANDAIHRDGGPECDQPGTPRRVYVFDPDALSEHEAIVAQWAIRQAQPHPDDPDRPAEQELGHSIPMNFPIPDTACPIPDANPDATIPPDRGSWRSTITQATITAQSSAARRAAPLPLPLTA